MSDWTPERMREMGMTEREIQQELCDPHTYAPFEGGTLCTWTPFGCSRTCTKCGQTTVDPNHCGQFKRRSTSATQEKKE